MKYLIWALRIIAAVIMLQTLFFKFSGAPESLYIFDKVGAGDAGRYGSGIIELVASILLLIPRFSIYGSLIGMLTMFGAIGSHLTILGIEVMDDGGTLFIMANIVFICCLLNFWLTRKFLN